MGRRLLIDVNDKDKETRDNMAKLTKRSKPTPEQRAAILNARATHPDYGPLWFEAITQDRREYYRMRIGESTGGSLTTAARATEAIEYWQAKGWM